MEIDKFFLSLSSNPKLYARLSALERASLDQESKVAVQKYLLDCKRNGATLSETDRAIFLEKRRKIAELESQFQRNIFEDRTKVNRNIQPLYA